MNRPLDTDPEQTPLTRPTTTSRTGTSALRHLQHEIPPELRAAILASDAGVVARRLGYGGGQSHALAA